MYVHEYHPLENLQLVNLRHSICIYHCICFLFFCYISHQVSFLNELARSHKFHVIGFIESLLSISFLMSTTTSEVD